MQASIEQQKILVDLQVIDNAIFILKRELSELTETKQLGALEHRKLQVQADLQAAEAEEENVEREVRRIEVDAEQVANRITRDETRLASGNATPKELESLQHEIVSLKARKNEIEDVELEAMVRLEAVKKSVADLRADLVEIDRFSSELELKRDENAVKFSHDLDLKASERSELTAMLDSALVDLYEKIRKQGDNVGVARISAGKCDGCNLSINVVEFNRIKNLPIEEIVRCEECRRILVRI